MSKPVWPRPVLAKAILEFVQDEDCFARTKAGFQTLTVQIEEDGGGGYFYSFKTTRWAKDGPLDGTDGFISAVMEEADKLEKQNDAEVKKQNNL